MTWKVFGNSPGLLPSGDTYYLLWGADRELLVPEAKRQATLWTTRVWPGALSADELSIEPWRRFSSAEQKVVEAELPLPGLNGPLTSAGANARMRFKEPCEKTAQLPLPHGHGSYRPDSAHRRQ
jgi:hypothetical protein